MVSCPQGQTTRGSLTLEGRQLGDCCQRLGHGDERREVLIGWMRLFGVSLSWISFEFWVSLGLSVYK